MTSPRNKPSIGDIDYLLATNAPVGCNGNSFIVRFLIDALHFRPENIRKIGSLSEYPGKFESGEIKAAFFVAPHAKIYLAEHCKGYTMAGPSIKLGGFGFVRPNFNPVLSLDTFHFVILVGSILLLHDGVNLLILTNTLAMRYLLMIIICQTG